MTITQCRIILDHELENTGLEFSIEENSNTSLAVATDEKMGILGRAKSKIEFLVANMAYVNYLVKEGFEESHIAQYENIWIPVDNLDEFIKYFKNEKFKFVGKAIKAKG